MEDSDSEGNMNFTTEVSTFDLEFERNKFNEEFTKRVLPVSVIFGLTACVGFLSNVVVVYIYGIKYKQCNFKYFLFMMGVIGLVQCSIMLPTQAAEMHYWFVFPTSWLCRVSAYVFGYTIIACCLVLLLVAIDRFRKVCRPYDWQIQSHTARSLCILVSVVSLIFATPPGIVSGPHNFDTLYNGRNITVTVCATDDIYQDRDWAVYFLILFGGIPVGVIILVTIVLYALILRQFYYGPAITLKSLYNTSTTRISPNPSLRENRGDPTDSSTPTVTPEGTPEKKPKLLKVELNHNNKVTTLKKVFCSILRTDEKLSPKSSPLRSSGSNLTKREVRSKLLRKTLVIIIITLACIVALVLTFCLHMIAEDVNRGVLSIPTPQLNSFVIFHRGSFSIILAMFPIIYGFRDHKFRDAFRQMFTKNAQKQTVVCVPNNTKDATRC